MTTTSNLQLLNPSQATGSAYFDLIPREIASQIVGCYVVGGGSSQISRAVSRQMKCLYEDVFFHLQSLIKIWSRIQGQINLPVPFTTALKIKDFLNNVSNKPTLDRIQKLSLSNSESSFFPLQKIEKSGLSILPPEIAKFTYVRSLSLSHNKLRALIDLSGLTKLYMLDLSHNELCTSLDLSGLIKLTWLDLSHNKLNAFPVLSQQSQQEMVWFDFSHNLLWTRPDVSGFIKVFRLSFDGNPFTFIPLFKSSEPSY